MVKPRVYLVCSSLSVTWPNKTLSPTVKMQARGGARTPCKQLCIYSGLVN